MTNFSLKASLVKVLTALFILATVACSKDDDGGGGTGTSGLIGKWVCIHDEGYEKDGAGRETWNDEYDVDDEEYYIIFKEDGTCTFLDGGYIESSKYRRSGNKLTIIHDDEDEDENEVLTIESLTSSRLILSLHEKEGTYEYYMKMTFVKVSGNNSDNNVPSIQGPNENGIVAGLNNGKVSEIWDGSFDISWYNASATLFAISTAEQLAGVVQLVKSGTTFYNQTIMLQNNIRLNGKININEEYNVTNEEKLKLWEGIGLSEPDKRTFRGTFDGHGFYVSGVYGNSFFNYCASAVVRNLGIVNSYVFKGSYNRIGGIVSYADAHNNTFDGTKIHNCYNMGVVKGYAGIVCGAFGRSEIKNCFNAGKVFSVDASDASASAIVAGMGENVRVTGCYNIGECTHSIIGGNSGSVTNCYTLSGSCKTYNRTERFNRQGIITTGSNKDKTLLEVLNASDDVWIVKNGVNGGFPIHK